MHGYGAGAYCILRGGLTLMASSGVIDEGAVVCRGATIKGPVSIGPGTVVHPSAFILAEVCCLLCV